MKLTLLIDLTDTAPAKIDDFMRYDAAHDIGFASITAPTIQTIQSMLPKVVHKLQHMKKNGESETGGTTTDINRITDASRAEIGKRMKAFEDTPKGKKVASGIQKGDALCDKSIRSGLYSDEAAYLHDIATLDAWDGIEKPFYLGFYRGYNLGKNKARNRKSKNTMVPLDKPIEDIPF